MELLKTLNHINESMCDNESRKIFNARLKYSMFKNEREFIEEIGIMERELVCIEWENFARTLSENVNIVIFGAGTDGIFTLKLLKRCGWEKNIVAFGDNNTFLWNTFQEGLPIYSVDTIKEKYIDAVIVIASKKYVSDIYSQLLVQGLNRKNIFYPRYKQLIGSTGNQYFDLPYFFVDKGNEVFVDAGCFDGMTSVAFAEWCSYSYSEIYAFEPDKLCGGRCIKTFKDYNIRDAHFINKGTYDSNKVLSFASNGTASGKVGNSIESIEVTSIDEVLAGKPATFIKMDVEGSEMASLIGAQQTIRKYRPKLAICVYHKPQDIIDIPAYILELVPDYKLYLRHYLTCPWETVLYAV